MHSIQIQLECFEGYIKKYYKSCKLLFIHISSFLVIDRNKRMVTRPVWFPQNEWMTKSLCVLLMRAVCYYTKWSDVLFSTNCVEKHTDLHWRYSRHIYRPNYHRDLRMIWQRPGNNPQLQVNEWVNME